MQAPCTLLQDVSPSDVFVVEYKVPAIEELAMSVLKVITT